MQVTTSRNDLMFENRPQNTWFTRRSTRKTGRQRMCWYSSLIIMGENTGDITLSLRVMGHGRIVH